MVETCYDLFVSPKKIPYQNQFEEMALCPTESISEKKFLEYVSLIPKTNFTSLYFQDNHK